MKLKEQEIRLRGVPVSPGIAIGKTFVLPSQNDVEKVKEIVVEDVEAEVIRYQKALKISEKEIQKIQLELEKEGTEEGAAILDAHLQVIQDPLMTLNIEEAIRQNKKNAESIFTSSINSYKEKFNSISDPFFRERFKDIQDICSRIMSHLNEESVKTLDQIPLNSIVLSEELGAADAAEADPEKVLAFITEQGGTTGHAAIVCRAKGIPYIANVDFQGFSSASSGHVIVDGILGEVILNPTKSTLVAYHRLQKQMDAHFDTLKKVGELKAQTQDGYTLKLSANIEMVNELEMLHQYGGNGVGLFRSEYVFLSKDHFPSEEEQFAIYKRFVEKMKGLPIVIRTFDIGGDKFGGGQKKPEEGNPFLGCRAIRFLLKEKEIFKTQLRAILRASLYGDVSIMFPMISGLHELHEAKKMVEEAKKELKERGIIIKNKVLIGSMIEVPSAAIIADLLAQECDFLSIGTNDLVQYSLAVDRGNQELTPLYRPTHPSIIRLIKLVVTEANRFNIPVTVCGEVAADPRFTPLLMGLGVHELSVASRYLPVVKYAIRQTTLLESVELAEHILGLRTSQEILQVLSEHYKNKVPEDFIHQNS